MSNGLEMMMSARATASAPVYTEHMTANRLASIIVGAVFTALGTFVIILRCWIVVRRMRAFGKDDIFMFIAWVASMGFAIASYISLRWGVGLLAGDAPPDWVYSVLKAVYAVEIFYYFSLFFIKMSLLFLYLRLTSSQKSSTFWKSTVATMGLVTAQFISTVVVVPLQCVPIQKYWNPTMPGHCISITAFFYSTNIFTIITDVLILALPISTLWQVQRPRRQRLAILGAFLVGGISTIASCVRLYSVRIYTESDQPMRDAAPINTWSFIEINLGIVCASAPALKALMSSQHRAISKFSNKYHSDRSTGNSSKPSKGGTVSIFGLSDLTTKGGRTGNDSDSEQGLRDESNRFDDVEQGHGIVLEHLTSQQSDEDISSHIGARSNSMKRAVQQVMGVGASSTDNGSPPSSQRESLMRMISNGKKGDVHTEVPAVPKPASAKMNVQRTRTTSLAVGMPMPGPASPGIVKEVSCSVTRGPMPVVQVEEYAF